MRTLTVRRHRRQAIRPRQHLPLGRLLHMTPTRLRFHLRHKPQSNVLHSGTSQCRLAATPTATGTCSQPSLSPPRPQAYRDPWWARMLGPGHPHLPQASALAVATPCSSSWPRRWLPKRCWSHAALSWRQFSEVKPPPSSRCISAHQTLPRATSYAHTPVAPPTPWPHGTLASGWLLGRLKSPLLSPRNISTATPCPRRAVPMHKLSPT
mmetsp:Transcript_39511/g.100965  ORF Transcript_39511/g.100965 Transcript_39511/m.100965 type:complete len:209 (+) Transcript_39511:1394-2020(+)